MNLVLVRWYLTYAGGPLASFNPDCNRILVLQGSSCKFKGRSIALFTLKLTCFSSQLWQTNLSQVLSAPPSLPHHPSTNLSRRKTSSAYKSISNPQANLPRQLHSQLQRLSQTFSPSRPKYATSYLHLYQLKVNTARSAPFTRSLQHLPSKISKHQLPRAFSPSHIESC